MINLNSKPPFEEFIKKFTPLYKNPVLEDVFAREVNETAQSLLDFQLTDSQDEAQIIIDFLRSNDEFLGIMLSLVNLSAEKFKRILLAERFAQEDYGTEWDIDKIVREIKQNDEYAVRIAKLFIEADQNETLVRQVADFLLAQIELPNGWETVITDEKVIKNLIRRKLTGKYNDAKGKAIEHLVRSRLEDIQEKYGLTFEHGQVRIVQKEVDYAIPSCTEPFVMIMVSYMETTGSGQTARANEQNKMFQEVVGLNVRYPKEQRFLVNVIDGAGWLARRSDLIKMHAGCHYALTLKMLDQIEAIVCRFVPKKFFIKQQRPAITD